MNTNTSLLNSSEDELKTEINKKQNGPIAFKLMTSMRKHSMSQKKLSLLIILMNVIKIIY